MKLLLDTQVLLWLFLRSTHIKKTVRAPRMQRAGLAELPIVSTHTYGVLALPRHHRDPFDRLLIAQAQIESLTIVTNDRVFAEYDGKRIAA